MDDCSETSLQILIIDAFDRESSTGPKLFKLFKQVVIKCLQESGIHNPNLIFRRLNRLGDYVIDWQHGILNSESKKCAKMFDKLDMIFVDGDIKALPWNPLSMQLVSLFIMAHKMNKPVFASGATALTYVYSLSSGGTRFYVMNGPNGDLLDKLPHFPIYTGSSGTYPGVFLDNETGDLYSYDPKSNHWNPVCNTGVYYTSNCTSAQIQQSKKRFSRESRTADKPSDEHDISKVLDGDVTAYIRNRYLQHPIANGLDQCFLHSPVGHWFINNDGGLPSIPEMQMIADSIDGPVLINVHNSVLFASQIREGKSYKSTYKIVFSFVETTMTKMKESNTSRIDNSIYAFLFGLDDQGGTYDSTQDRMIYSPPLASFSVACLLPNGPKKVETPVMSLFTQAPTDNFIDYGALARDKLSTTRGKTPKYTVQNPLQARKTRMEKFLERTGYTETKTINDILRQQDKEDDPYNERDPPPESARELLSGIVMNTKFVAQRKKEAEAKLVPVQNIRVVSPKIEERIVKIALENDDVKYPGISRFEKPVHIMQQAYSRNHNTVLTGHYDHTQGKILLHKQDTVNIKEEGFAFNNTAMYAKQQQAANFQNSRPQSQSDRRTMSPSAPTRPKSANNSSSTRVSPSNKHRHLFTGFANYGVAKLANPEEIRVSTPLGNNVAQNWLPLHVPTNRFQKPPASSSNGTEDNNKTKKTGTGVNVGAMNTANGTPVVEATPEVVDEFNVPDVVVLKSDVPRPYSSYKRFDLMQQKDQDHTANPYKTPHEREMEDLMEQKRKNIAGAFQNCFGKASTMPLRPEGFIRCEAEYPHKCIPGVPAAATPIDCMVARIDDPDKRLFGSWK